LRTILPLGSGLLLLFAVHCSSGKEITIGTAAELHEALAAPVANLTIHLLPGTYDLTPTAMVDSSCGNCEDATTPVPCTVGLRISGGYVHLQGPEDRSAILRTHAGYGIFIEHCDSAVIERLTITGGERDTSGLATDAAIVVRNAAALLRQNLIVRNIGDSAAVATHVVGIMGICGRENSRLSITGNEIIGNSWDGIALFRDAVAVISGNVVDGVDKARGSSIGGGRGVGIGVTWNAKATIRGNLVKRYWKGIGLFVDAHGIVENNIVEDIITWGISLWDAGRGAPVGFIRRNIIYETGACGASITRSAEGFRTGEFTGNMIVRTGQNPKYDSPDYYCYQCALAIHALPSSFVLGENIFFQNRRASADLPDEDLNEDEFLQKVRAICHSLTEHPVLNHSMFATKYCKGI
jgi:hypothetical protein